jgi:2'-hydroxyisoflavone reductase
LKILIIGGTVFLGRHIVDAALQRGHQITLFNRGKDNPDLFPEVEKLRGDRTEDLSPLAGRRWDAVIDTCGYFPHVVRASAEYLAPAAGQYTFISTISVYADNSVVGMDESAPVAELEDGTAEEITGETYGPLKALCERVVEEVFPDRSLIIRPGLIVGPHDPTDRFTYWPYRIAEGGEVLAPGTPDAAVQIIDVRDLAEWTVRLVEHGATGTYHATGPKSPLTLEDVLSTSREIGGNDARLTWVDDQFLLEAGVQPWIELPLWLPDTEETRGMLRVDCSKALQAGLSFRPLPETVRDTLSWARTRPETTTWQAGMSRDRERELLASWQQFQSAR